MTTSYLLAALIWVGKPAPPAPTTPISLSTFSSAISHSPSYKLYCLFYKNNFVIFFHHIDNSYDDAIDWFLMGNFCLPCRTSLRNDYYLFYSCSDEIHGYQIITIYFSFMVTGLSKKTFL